jgi:hypothetical protein
MAISTTLVGVAVFSDMRKSSVRHAKEHMSMPDPAMEEKIPPRNPVQSSTNAFQLRATKEPGPEEESWKTVASAQITGRWGGSRTKYL